MMGVRSARDRIIALAGLVVIVAAALGILALLGVFGGEGGGEGIEDVVLLEPSEESGLAVGGQAGQLAPDFEISDFDGKRHRLSDFRGMVVYINFWATWCTPCILELPEIQELQERNPGNLVVFAVNRREDLDNAEAFFQNLPTTDGGKGVSFPVNGMDPDDTLYERYVRLFPEPMPVSVFINAEGVVSSVYNGLIRLPDMEEAVTEAMASTSAARGR